MRQLSIIFIKIIYLDYDVINDFLFGYHFNSSKF
jgi:hypothetical protein